MNFHVVTLFPEMIQDALTVGVVSAALRDGRIGLKCISPRKFTENVHETVDDRPFGGGDGMIMLAEPMARAHAELTEGLAKEGLRTIHVSPRGAPLNDRILRELAGLKNIVFISSRYGGVDQRFIDELVDEELSLGDYVVSGGELAVLVMIDAISRLLPGVLGNEVSTQNESFAPGLGLLEEPQFTRPREWRGLKIPEALLSGNHREIDRWKRQLSLLVTAGRRPELLRVSENELAQAREFLEKMSEDELALCGLKDKQLLRLRLENREKG